MKHSIEGFGATNFGLNRLKGITLSVICCLLATFALMVNEALAIRRGPAGEAPSLQGSGQYSKPRFAIKELTLPGASGLVHRNNVWGSGM
jgi:hypothetical protein